MKKILLSALLLSFLGCSGESSSGSGSNIAPPILYPPTAPKNVKVFVGDSRVTVSWDTVADADYYVVRYSRNSDLSSATGFQTANSKYEISTLTNGITYYIAVFASNTDGDSDFSEVVTAQPTNAKITGISASSDNQQITISWPAINGATNYTLYYGVSADTSQYKFDTMNTTHTVTELTNDIKYYFSVSYSNLFYESLKSDPIISIPLPICSTFPQSYGFESGYSSDWSGFGRFNTTSHTGSFSMQSNTGANFNNDFTSKTSFDLSKASSYPTLTFWHKYTIPQYNVSLNVQISTDSGETWTTLMDWYGNKGSTLSITSWTQVSIPLSAYKTKKVRIRFRADVGNSTMFHPWCIDDVTIQ